jgi:hypothetical protein
VLRRWTALSFLDHPGTAGGHTDGAVDFRPLAFRLRILAPGMIRLYRSKSVANTIIGTSLLRCRPEAML